VENYNEYKEYWYNHGKDKIKAKSYKLNGRFHRLDGPAYIQYNGDGSVAFEDYAINGQWHRIDGPAYIEYNKRGSIFYEAYYLLNKIISIEDFNTPGFIDAFILENS
jgi:hypothetical protein